MNRTLSILTALLLPLAAFGQLIDGGGGYLYIDGVPQSSSSGGVTNVAWGDITGAIGAQADLWAELTNRYTKAEILAFDYATATYVDTATNTLLGTVLGYGYLTAGSNVSALVNDANYVTATVTNGLASIAYVDIATNDLWSAVIAQGYLTAPPVTNTTTTTFDQTVTFPSIIVAGRLIDGSVATISVANVAFDADLIPTESNAFALGSQSYPLSDVWVSTGTVYIASVPIRSDGTNIIINSLVTSNNEAYLTSAPVTNETTVAMTNAVAFPNGLYIAGTLLDSVTNNISVSRITFDGSMIPNASNAYSLGSAEFPWASLYVDTNTIYIGNAALSVNTGGQLVTQVGTNTPTTGLQVGANVSELVNDAGYLTSYTESDPIWGAVSNTVTTGAALGATALQAGAAGTSTNLNDYNNDAGFLTSYTETDPVWSAVSNTVTTGSALGATALQSYTETDPIWSAVSNTVTTGSALGATALQSYTETDPIWSAVSNSVITDISANTAKVSYTDGAKVAGIENGATSNSTDAALLARANHTGTQLASTISDFQTQVSNNTLVVGAVQTELDPYFKSVSNQFYLASNPQGFMTSPPATNTTTTTFTQNLTTRQLEIANFDGTKIGGGFYANNSNDWVIYRGNYATVLGMNNNNTYLYAPNSSQGNIVMSTNNNVLSGSIVWKSTGTASSGTEIVNYQTATNLLATLNPQGFGVGDFKADGSVSMTGNLDLNLNAIEAIAGVTLLDGSGIYDGVGQLLFDVTAYTIIDETGTTAIEFSSTSRNLDASSGSPVFDWEAQKLLEVEGVWQSEGKATNGLEIVNYQTMTNQGYLTAEADTLQSVTTRGASTTNALSFDYTGVASAPVEISGAGNFAAYIGGGLYSACAHFDSQSGASRVSLADGSGSWGIKVSGFAVDIEAGVLSNSTPVEVHTDAVAGRDIVNYQTMTGMNYLVSADLSNYMLKTTDQTVGSAWTLSDGNGDYIDFEFDELGIGGNVSVGWSTRSLYLDNGTPQETLSWSSLVLRDDPASANTPWTAEGTATNGLEIVNYQTMQAQKAWGIVGITNQATYTTPSTFTAVTNWLTTGVSNQVALTTTGLVCTVAGDYSIEAVVSASGGNSATHEYQLQKNGTAILFGTQPRKLGTGGDVGNASISSQVTLASNDVVNLAVKADGGNVVIEKAHIRMSRLGD